eukprot:TRINITY_DN1209_c0_g1_i2.p1 TRINITY_DN1209_c0_g1~~TRINITY_DN1209_c0_g1_i2.p1  ORF type:complete len:512 (+),score=179.44 TRINITY_DN1209_c0_g1_i2:49-1536(+)
MCIRDRFCGEKNKLTIEEAAFPAVNPITYILQAAPEAPAATVSATEDKKIEDAVSVLFCLDVSGSMDATTSVSKKMKYANNDHVITRLEALKIAIDSQIEKMAKETPNMKVGFVTFESAIELIGDGTYPPKKFSGADLSEFHSLVEKTLNDHEKFMSQPVGKTKSALLEKLAGINTGGGTALGPGLVVAAALASKGAPGSRVIICTDGMANEGMGSISGDLNTTKLFYNQVGEYAQQHGIIVSIISLVSSECRLDLLSPIANLTSGDIVRIDPTKLSTDFSAFISEKIIATAVNVKVKLHKVLQYRRVLPEFLSEDKSVYTLKVGNVTRDTQVTFEYCMKPISQLALMADVDLAVQKKFPFQAQIEYKSLDGKKCVKVITQFQEFTEKIEESKQGVNMNVVQTHSLRSAAEIAQRGNYEESSRSIEQYAQLASNPTEKKKFKNATVPFQKAVMRQKQTGSNAQCDEMTIQMNKACLLYTSPSPRDQRGSRMPSSA